MSSGVDYQSYLYLYAAMSQSNVASLVRSYCIQEEITNLSTTITSWQQARTTLEQISNIDKNGFFSRAKIIDSIAKIPTFFIADNPNLMPWVCTKLS